MISQCNPPCDGCYLCDTKQMTEGLLTPSELANGLIIHGSFTGNQANYIAEEVYQPLAILIVALNKKVQELSEKIDK